MTALPEALHAADTDVRAFNAVYGPPAQANVASTCTASVVMTDGHVGSPGLWAAASNSLGPPHLLLSKTK